MSRLILCCLIALTLPLAADTVRLKDGREFKGEVTEEGDKIRVKMKLGTITLNKSDVTEIVKDDASGGGAPAAGGADRTYKSYLLGYVLHVPTTKYVVQRVPPEPLTDVILYDSGSECEISLMLCSTDDIPATLDGATATKLGEMVRGGLAMYFSKLDVVSAAAVKLGPYDTARVVLEGIRGDNKRKQHLVRLFFRLHDKPMELSGDALLGKHKALDEDVNKIVETLEAFEPKEMLGDTLVDMQGCYTITKPEGWKVSHGDDPGKGIRSMVLESQSPRCFVSVMVAAVRSKGDMREVGKYTETVVLTATKDAVIASSKAANLKGRVAWDVRYTSKNGPGDLKLGPCVSHAVAFRTVDRIYYVDVTSIQADAAKAEAATAPIFDSFQIYPDLLSKGSIENGRQAQTVAREADEKRLGGNAAASIALFDKAIDLYPPFSTAYNNRALAHMDADDFDAAYKDLQVAVELAPNDFMATRNMAMARITKAYKSLDDGRISSAIDEADRMRSRAKDDEELANLLGIFYYNVGIHYYEQNKLGAAKTFLKKGMEFYSDKVAVKKGLSVIAYNEAIEALNKENWRSAKSFLEESLKYDPSNAAAKDALGKVNQELSK